MYHYQWGIGAMLDLKLNVNSNIVEKDTKFKFTHQENIMLAVSSLAILFSIIEMILAFASAKSCGETGPEPSQESRVCIGLLLIHVQSDGFLEIKKSKYGGSKDGDSSDILGP